MESVTKSEIFLNPPKKPKNHLFFFKLLKNNGKQIMKRRIEMQKAPNLDQSGVRIPRQRLYPPHLSEVPAIVLYQLHAKDRHLFRHSASRSYSPRLASFLCWALPLCCYASYWSALGRRGWWRWWGWRQGRQIRLLCSALPCSSSLPPPAWLVSQILRWAAVVLPRPLCMWNLIPRCLAVSCIGLSALQRTQQCVYSPLCQYQSLLMRVRLA